MKSSNIVLRYTKQSTGEAFMYGLDGNIPLTHHREEARALVQTGETRMAEVILCPVGPHRGGVRYFIDATGAVVEEYFSERIWPPSTGESN